MMIRSSASSVSRSRVHARPVSFHFAYTRARVIRRNFTTRSASERTSPRGPPPPTSTWDRSDVLDVERAGNSPFSPSTRRTPAIERSPSDRSPLFSWDRGRSLALLSLPYVAPLMLSSNHLSFFHHEDRPIDAYQQENDCHERDKGQERPRGETSSASAPGFTRKSGNSESRWHGNFNYTI